MYLILFQEIVPSGQNIKILVFRQDNYRKTNTSEKSGSFLETGYENLKYYDF